MNIPLLVFVGDSVTMQIFNSLRCEVEAGRVAGRIDELTTDVRVPASAYKAGALFEAKRTNTSWMKVRPFVTLRLTRLRLHEAASIGLFSSDTHVMLTARAESAAAALDALFAQADDLTESPLAAALRPAYWVVNMGLWHALCFLGSGNGSGNGRFDFSSVPAGTRCNDPEYEQHVTRLLDVLLARGSGPVVWRDITAAHTSNFDASVIADARLRAETVAKFAAFGHEAIMDLNARAHRLIASRYAYSNQSDQHLHQPQPSIPRGRANGRLPVRRQREPPPPNATQLKRLHVLADFFNATRDRADGTMPGDMRHYSGEVLHTLQQILWLHVCGDL